MIVGIPAEIKDNENRIAMVPGGVHELVERGHTVLVQHGGGLGSGFSDDDYRAAGAEIVAAAPDIFKRANMIIKVKEPQEAEYRMMRGDQLVFTYFHFAADETLTRGCMESGATCIAYETIEDANGHLPLLTPMSEVAGRMAVQVGAHFLQNPEGGRGVLLSGVPGVPASVVVIVGAGVVGTQACWMAAGLGARVTILDIDLDRLRYLDDIMPANVTTLASNPHNIRAACARADLLVGAVLIEGAKAPTLVPRTYLADMKDGSVIVDVAVDQGGCVETSKPTTHSSPTYVVDGVLHYCVANMPGAVPRTSTYALTNATLPYAIRLADGGLDVVRGEPGFATGINVSAGKITHKAVAAAFGLDYTPVKDVLGGS
ncbi:MAG: alanine dehydrogenase [Proteobacteria bacterium]|nr:alanine dehydrogenase [Pseudomonadota bacterium]